MRSWDRSVGGLAVVYFILFGIIDFYIVDSIFIKYTPELKGPMTFNATYFSRLMLFWLVKSFAYVSFCIAVANRRFSKFFLVDIDKLVKSIMLPICIFFIIFYTVLFAACVFWFNALYSSVVNIVFYVFIYGLVFRRLFASRCSNDLDYIYVSIIVLNLLPICIALLATVLLLVGIDSVVLEHVYMFFWGRQRNAISFYYDATNLSMYLFAVSRCRLICDKNVSR